MKNYVQTRKKASTFAPGDLAIYAETVKEVKRNAMQKCTELRYQRQRPHKFDKQGI